MMSVMLFAAIIGIQVARYYFDSPLHRLPAKIAQLSVQELEAHEAKSELKILVVGKHGIGKHTLVTELFGDEGQKCSIDGSSTCDKFNINGVSSQVLILDSPSLNSHLFERLDLVIFAIRMDDTRYRGDDQEMLKALPLNSWSKGMIVLTFANRVTFVDPDTGKERQSKEHMMKKAKDWENSTHGTLRDKGVPHSVLSEMPFISVGHPSKFELYDNAESWKTSLIKCMIVRLKASGMEASAAMWQVMKDSVPLPKDESAIECEW